MTLPRSASAPRLWRIATESDDDDGSITSTPHSITVRPRFKAISTGRGTETEDEPIRPLPTSRIPPPRTPPPTPILFHALRSLAIVPALIGTISHIRHFLHPPPYTPSNPNTRLDYFAAALWSILTGLQCLYLTTGLLVRWKAYYPPLASIIRLLALQAICWPATHLTLSFLQQDGTARPLACWAVIGTTTCVSRSVQMWVTSNLWWDHSDDPPSPTHPHNGVTNGNGHGLGLGEKGGAPRGSKWRGRKWDWNEVTLKCVLPASTCYVVMAWVGIARRELLDVC